MRQFTPYGETIALMGSTASLYGFTGEPTDPNGLVHLRARNYLPELGVFPSLDRVMGTNRYGYVAGDPSGQIPISPFLPKGYLPPPPPPPKKPVTPLTSPPSGSGTIHSGTGQMQPRSQPTIRIQLPVRAKPMSGLWSLLPRECTYMCPII